MTLAEVYLAEPPRLPRRDAVKILGSDISAGVPPEVYPRGRSGCAVRLWHPHIVAVHDRGEYDGQLWIAMDYVEGTDGAHLIRRYAAGLPVGEVAGCAATSNPPTFCPPSLTVASSGFCWATSASTANSMTLVDLPQPT